MITEDYVSYKVAKLLKEKGFEIDTNLDYWKIGEDGTKYFMCSIGAYTSDSNNPYAFYRPENSYPCPTQAMAMKWLRETHSIAIEPMLLSHGWFCQIEKILEDFCKEYIDETDSYKTYEEAVEAALKCVLKNII